MKNQNREAVYGRTGIYKITSPSGRIYIGQSWDIKKRWAVHRNRTPLKHILYDSFKKYGHKNHLFEIIHTLASDTTQEILNNLEIYYIAQYREAGHSMMNYSSGGNNFKHTDESKAKMSIAGKGKVAWNKGLTKHSDPRLMEESKRRMGITLSDEIKNKISISKTGSKMPNKRIIPEDVRLKISKTISGRKMSTETRRKISEGLKTKRYAKNN